VFGSLVRRMRLAIAAAALAGLALAPPASAATKVVFAGYDDPPGAPIGTLAEGFYPDKITIRAGDSVQWQFRGVHDVAFLAKGEKRPPFVVTDDGSRVAGQTDSSGQPFWFNGRPSFLENARVITPHGARTYTGAGLFNSGVPAAGPTYTLKFPRPGSYHYQDPVHPGTHGTVNVVSKRGRVPTKRADNALAAAQITHATDTARALVHAPPPPPGVIEVGREAKGVAVSGFFPGAVTIAAGQSLTFQVPSRGVELHTVTLGQETASLARNVVAQGSFNPVVAYPSDPPPSLPDYTGSNHGVGFLNTGLLDGDPKTALPGSATIRFANPGTYEIVDLMHPGPAATVTVSG
jgi:plastocyanin